MTTATNPDTIDLPIIGTLTAIHERCSVRAYTPARLDRATISRLLAAAVRAPTAMHQEPWRFVVIQDPVLLDRLSQRAKAFLVATVHRLHPDHDDAGLARFARPDFDAFYHAGTLIVICGRPETPFLAADCWLAAANLMLAAHALDLGTCVIGAAVEALNDPAIKAEIGIPPDLTAVAPIIVGVPEAPGVPTPRKAPVVDLWK